MKKSKKRLKATQTVTKRLFQDEIDEEDAKRQCQENLEKMKQADERLKKLKAEKDARMKEQFEARVKEELEKRKLKKLRDSRRNNGWKNIRES